ncbi:MAG: pyruvate kinase [Candidatus Omnitrophica bacterium]|nr:pyruvate kinase [Candidatus Omnitrophota bacterium]
MGRTRDTNIICTLGPTSAKESVLIDMARKGMSIARLNFSHGNHEGHQKMIDMIREVNDRYNFKIEILQDLEGYRIRIGHFEEPIDLVPGRIVYMSNRRRASSRHLPFDYPGDVKHIKKGMEIFIDDGTICLEVIGHKNDQVQLEVRQGGLLRQRKGINIPKMKLSGSIFTQKDRNDLAFGIKNQVDYVAQSFVRSKSDILRIVKITSKEMPGIRVIAKIESHEGVRNIDKIMEACDGIMVARGDLGVSLPIYQIPVIQKYIIHRCGRKKKFVIVATQMLESMTEHTRPTRAEVSDVANAILDGADFVMLSGETAVGKHPVLTINMMRQVIEYTEKYENGYM